MSVLDGLWRPVFYVFYVMRVMAFVMEERCVLQFIACGCFVGSVVLGFAGKWWMIL